MILHKLRDEMETTKWQCEEALRRKREEVDAMRLEIESQAREVAVAWLSVVRAGLSFSSSEWAFIARHACRRISHRPIKGAWYGPP